MRIKPLKIILGVGITTAVLAGGAIAFYIKGLPYVISHPKTIAYIQNFVKEKTDADLTISNPVLVTRFSPSIDFKVDKIYLTKNNTKLLELNNFNSSVSLRKILAKNIIIKKLVAENIYADVNKIQSIIPQVPQKEEKSNWGVDIFDALLGVRECEILYSLNPETNIHLKGEHIGVNNAEKIKKNVYFQLSSVVKRKDKHVTLKLKDNNKVYFKDNLFHIENCPLSINNSNIFINLAADRKKNFDINLFSKNLNINDILDFLNTQIIENNVQQTLSYFSDIQGNLDFKLNIKKDSLNGSFKLNRASFKVKDVNNIPITFTKGNVNLTSNEVKLNNFEGFYDNNPKNKISFEGNVKDYLNTIDTNIEGKALVRNDFFKKYLSKMTGSDFEIIGDAPTKITLKSKNNIMDFVWLFMLKPGQNIKISQNALPFEDSLRLMKSEMHLENMVLDIKSLDYHMIPSDQILTKEEYAKKRAQGHKPQPIFRIKSSIDIKDHSNIKFIGFEFPQALPSELLNVAAGLEIFKRGLITGSMTLDNRGPYPVLNGNMAMEKVIIPIQKMYVKKAEIKAKDKLIHIEALGGYRRAKFSFGGDIVNEIKYPIIIKDTNLSLENIDTYQVLEAFNNPSNASDNIIKTDEGLVKVENQNNEFDIRNIVIEKGRFHLDKGTYKDIEFSNLDADLTLNNGIVDIKSNRFDFANGRSSLRTNLDLVNHKYNVKLGILDVDSDILASALLDLKKEIVGKASGFLDLTTDDSAKLTGSIKFVVKDGVIEKIGLVEYVLKCASILRNTVTMISPAILSDIINIPKGKFDKITGDIVLNNNVATGIKIKTYSPDLSTYIAGRYNIDNGDTSLRIYTKFSSIKKGFAGFLRKISLNSLANRIPMNSRNDANYYAIELSELPPIEANEKDCQIYLTRVEGDVVNNNYISSLKKLK